MIERQNDLPRCFGKDWDDKVPACAGGLDPTYKDPETGSRVRERCMFFSPCGAQVAAKRTSLIPQSQLVRQPLQVAQQPAAAQPNQSVQLAQAMKKIEELQQLVYQQAAHMQGKNVPFIPYLQQPPQPQMMAVEYKMPGYLTVPEPRTSSASVWTLLGREITRSMFKSAGHTLANFWDVTPIGKPDSDK